MIARLETAKISSSIQLEKMKSVGIKKFRWRHSGGGKDPRPLHQSYDGMIFSFDDLPIIDEKKRLEVYLERYLIVVALWNLLLSSMKIN